ncbi:MAG: ABC transporter permease [Acidobacteria bacterium]|nr:ABC transporter permease [Acidobacteriota bacterium]MBV9478670.1 ABC transporter permease [Acidobacteriota bacterium]
MHDLLFDFRFGLRALLRNRGFALISIATLALALGANSAIFSVVNAILLRPLPFSTSDRLVTIAGYNAARGSRAEAEINSWPNLADVHKQSRKISRIAAWSRSAAFLYPGGEPVRLNGASVGRELFEILDVKPELGRPFTAAEDSPGAAPVIALSHATWTRDFGADPGIIGRSIRFGTAGKSRVVVAVLPPGVRFPIDADPVDFWIPVEPLLEANYTERGAWYLDAIGLLAPGATVDQAQADATLIAKRLEKAYPENDTNFRLAIDSLQDRLTQNVRPSLLLLMTAVGVVLLIGCANVANLSLARGAARHREIAIRAALGATRARIVRQLLAESLLLALGAGVVGLLFASWGLQLLVSLAPPGVPRLDAVTLDARVLAFALALSVATGLLFGLAPALAASKTNLTETLNDATRGSTEGRKRNRVRNAIVVAEIALSLVMLVGAGLLLRSFVQLLHTNPGFEPRGVAVLEVSPRVNLYAEDPQVLAMQNRILDELARTPGVQSAGLIDALPLAGDQQINTFTIVGHAPFPPGEGPAATVLSVTPTLFETMQITLQRGRPFTAHDDANAQPVVIVDETFANRFFPSVDPIGRQIAFHSGKPKTIVGVVRGIRFATLTEAPTMTFYLPQAQRTVRRVSIVARTADPDALLPAMRAIVRRIDPQQPVLGVRTLEAVRADTLAGRRFTLTLLGVLAALALLLAAVGIYSIMSYSVAQRTSEIGIRMALGARAEDVFRLIVGQAARVTAVGVGLGMIAALIVTRMMRSLLYGVAPGDPLTIVAICLLLGGVALVASWVPARRAARVDPLLAIYNS